MTADSPADLTGHFHAVRFYKDDDSLCRIVGSFLIEGLTKSEPAILIATPGHTKAIEECFRNASFDVVALKRLGELTSLDAREMLSKFMADDIANPGMFRDHIGGVIAQAGRGRGQCTIRAYGEMVDLLWKDGMTAAAIQVETLWNHLARTHDFKLLCGYSMGNFYKGAAIDEITRQHSHVMSDVG